MPPEGELQALRERLDTQRKELLRSLQGMAEEAGERQPAGEWSVKQQLAHLCQGESAWLGWALSVREHPGSEVGQAPGQEAVFTQEVDTANAYPLSYWVTRLKLVRMETLRQLREASITGEELETKGRHRSFGEMTVLQFLRALYRHDRMHAEQILGKPTTFVPGQRPST